MAAASQAASIKPSLAWRGEALETLPEKSLTAGRTLVSK